MNPAAKRRAGRPATELIESATHLLRTAPAGVLLAYYVGSIPCVLGLLYFWADMSRDAFARERLVEASFVAALGYLWMKCWHAVFAAKLRDHLLLDAGVPWTVTRVWRLVLVQVALQPIGLFVRLLAAQVLIPYVWTYSFFQNVGVLGDGTTREFGDVVRESAKQAGLWPRQAHFALLGVLGFMLFVWLDICVVVGFAPLLLKMFLGIETVFSRDPMTMLNTTMLAATLAGTYLCVDPIRKALFVLRCFQGASLKSGEDLHVELKSFGAARKLGVAGLLLCGAVCGTMTGSVRAAETPPARVESAELNGALDRVLQQREYAWRLPRAAETGEDARKGWLTTFLEGVWKKLVHTVKEVLEWIQKAYEWLRKAFDRQPPPRSSSERGSINWSATARWTLLVLIAALGVIVGLLLWRWRGRRPAVVIAQPLAAIPDLNEESVTADQLPEDGWLQLARDLMQSGDLRLALRALYLAGLAHLGQRELIQIARHKSNRDYDRELGRRARGNAGLLTAFDANLHAFEASWYGEHMVTANTLEGFSENLERIRAC